MDIGDIEGTAQSLYRKAGLEPSDIVSPLTLVTSLLGPNTVRLVHAAALPGGAALARVGQEWRIYVRQFLPPQQKRFVLLHELAHWALGVTAEEATCDALAAALLLPRPAFLQVLRRQGHRLPALAEKFGTTESCVALRIAETTDEPTALVTPRSVRVRGAEFGWPTEGELRQIARGSTPGIRKAVLRDDPRRTLLKGAG